VSEGQEPDDALYRPNVGILLLNRANRAFVARRIDTPGEAWQMPQGGIDEGEEPHRAALRELEEEIGTGNAEIIAETKGWLHYDLPAEIVGRMWGGRYRGQRQKWFAMRFLGRDEEINLATGHPEFSDWRWVSPDELPALIVPFKRPLYVALVEEFRYLWQEEK
jgi:putative (di)nucleoside polyphosphate hydrolase